jgi:hypothetical protein
MRRIAVPETRAGEFELQPGRTIVPRPGAKITRRIGTLASAGPSAAGRGWVHWGNGARRTADGERAMTRLAWVGLAALLATCVTAGESAVKPREALQPFNDLIGSWKGTGVPEGSREEKQRGFWTETIAWEWHFKGDDASLKAKFENGKYFTKAELRALSQANHYRLTVETADKQTLMFDGELQDRKLTLERTDAATKETHRLTLRLLHSNRVTYQYDVKPDGKTLYVKKYQVGATKEGEPFAAGTTAPECVVSGGLGTIQVSYKGKTYYFCCTGCRDEFRENPEKYIKEYEERKKKKQ